MGLYFTYLLLFYLHLVPTGMRSLAVACDAGAAPFYPVLARSAPVLEWRDESRSSNASAKATRIETVPSSLSSHVSRSTGSTARSFAACQP